MRGPCATALLGDLPLEVENDERRQWVEAVWKHGNFRDGMGNVTEQFHLFGAKGSQRRHSKKGEEGSASLPWP